MSNEINAVLKCANCVSRKYVRESGNYYCHKNQKPNKYIGCCRFWKPSVSCIDVWIRRKLADIGDINKEVKQ